MRTRRFRAASVVSAFAVLALSVAAPAFPSAADASAGRVNSVHAATGLSMTPGDLPPGLRPTQGDITNDTTHRYGEPELAVNPLDPNNLVYMVMQEAYTYACQSAHKPACTQGGTTGILTVPGIHFRQDLRIL